MGFFSFITADTKRSIANCYSSKSCFPVAVLIPNEFGGGRLVERSYNGYGRFGGRDVYELLAEWNQKYLTEDNIEKPNRNEWGNDEKSQMYFKSAMERYEGQCQLLRDYRDGVTETSLTKKYGEEWKRELGIVVAGEDEYMCKLKYPLKIVEGLELSYEDISSVSVSCPDQGYFY